MGYVQGRSVVLRVLCIEYIDQYMKMLSPTVQKILAIASPEDERSYLLRQLKKIETNTTFFMCIFKSDQLIGAIEIRSKAYRSQLYNWLNEGFWGKGYYQEALSLAIRGYFSLYPSEDSFNARVDVSNKRSYHALKKMGFTESGIVQGARGPQYDLVYYSLI